ncbi:MAG: hypothetical protein P1U56_09475 [Saprospiraceae bacterium]|nr:hypothetical protein [Saprospiraceae bacterium]
MKQIIFYCILLLPLNLLAQENVGIGTDNPQGKLHLETNSGVSIPQLRLTETGFDYARIKFENDQNPGVYWDIAGLADSIAQNSKLNFYFKSPEATGDRLTILGNGNIGISKTSPEARLDIKGGSWNLEGGSTGDLRIGTSTYNMRFGVATGGGGAGIGRIFTGQGVNNLIFGTNDTRRMVIHESGNIGIGLDNPVAKLHVNGDMRVNNLAGSGDRNVMVDSNGKFKIGGSGAGDTDWTETGTLVYTTKTARLLTTTTQGPVTNTFYIDMNSGGIDRWSTLGSSAPYGSTLNLQGSSSGDLFMVEGGGNVGIGGPANSKLTVTGNDNNGTTASLEIKTISGTMLVDDNELDVLGQGRKLHINANSDNPVTIGTYYIPSDYLLAVDGKIIAEEVRVQMSGDWPDYVFKEDYHLKSLKEVESHIENHGHLPGIPSAIEVEKEGLTLGEMQRKMMEKIEELTLYVIELDKENALLKKELQAIKKSIK